jgi:hypothetical protein
MTSLPVDDSTAAYILETRKCFEDLRQVAAQIAGVLVLAAAGGDSATPDHPMLSAAAGLHAAATDLLRSIRPTQRALAHHRCLTQAADSLAIALLAAKRTEIDPILVPVRAAYAHLQSASHTLPGFEMVAFAQGCCAVHLTL